MDKFKKKSLELAILSFISLLNDFEVYPFRLDIFFSEDSVESVQVNTHECYKGE